jgi:membrane protease YdiL (CAAX protease family)
MTNQYLEQARQGKNEFWRYILTILAVVWVAIIAQLIVASVAFIAEGTININQFSPMATLLVTMIPFPCALLALWGGLRLLHKRPLISLINPSGNILWKRALFSGVVWFVLSALTDVIFSLINPSDYVWSFNFKKFLPYFIAAVLLIPIQTSTEELFFRGYFTQWMGRFSKGIWLPLIIPSIVFMLLHSLNPEVTAYGFLLTMPLYLGIGLLLGWLTLRSQGIEMAIGLHAANNLYAALIVTFPSSALPSPALFSINKYDPVYGLIALAGMTVVYLAILYLSKRAWLSPAANSNSEIEN